jgi:hypothetical protein
MPFLSNAVVFMGNGTTELLQEGFRSWSSYFCKAPYLGLIKGLLAVNLVRRFFSL